MDPLEKGWQLGWHCEDALIWLSGNTLPEDNAIMHLSTWRPRGEGGRPWGIWWEIFPLGGNFWCCFHPPPRANSDNLNRNGRIYFSPTPGFWHGIFAPGGDFWQRPGASGWLVHNFNGLTQPDEQNGRRKAEGRMGNFAAERLEERSQCESNTVGEGEENMHLDGNGCHQ